MKRFLALVLALVAVGVMIASSAPQHAIASCGPTGATGDPCIDSEKPEDK